MTIDIEYRREEATTRQSGTEAAEDFIDARATFLRDHSVCFEKVPSIGDAAMETSGTQPGCRCRRETEGSVIGESAHQGVSGKPQTADPGPEADRADSAVRTARTSRPEPRLGGSPSSGKSPSSGGSLMMNTSQLTRPTLSLFFNLPPSLLSRSPLMG
ncbi:hypothetical protein CVT30_45095 [Streptomyces sp. AMCC400023]|nr:hypothetical protein CVT30_45095 [Streptomyces sp. AMCC400023]